MNGNDDLYVPNSNVNEANSNVDNSWTDNDNNGRAWVRVKTLLHTFAPAANLAPGFTQFGLHFEGVCFVDKLHF